MKSFVVWIVLFAIFIPPLMLLALAIYRTATRKPAADRIAAWAAANRLQVIEAEKRYLVRGPFSLERGAGDVYRIVVCDSKEKMKKGWLCLGVALFGSDYERVKWSGPEEKIPRDWMGTPLDSN